MKRTEQKIPEPIVKAIDHVRTFFPNVCLVVFNDMGRWQYMDDCFRAPNFKGVPVDISLLEEASNAAYEDSGHPSVYQAYASSDATC